LESSGTNSIFKDKNDLLIQSEGIDKKSIFTEGNSSQNKNKGNASKNKNLFKNPIKPKKHDIIQTIEKSNENESLS